MSLHPVSSRVSAVPRLSRARPSPRISQVVAVSYIELVAALRKKHQAGEGEGGGGGRKVQNICMRGEVLITRASSSLRYKLSVTALRADNYRTIRVR